MYNTYWFASFQYNLGGKTEMDNCVFSTGRDASFSIFNIEKQIRQNIEESTKQKISPVRIISFQMIDSDMYHANVSLLTKF